MSFLLSLPTKRGFVVSGINSANIHSAVCDFGACLVSAIEPISSLCRRVVCTRILSPSPDPNGISSHPYISFFIVRCRSPPTCRSTLCVRSDSQSIPSSASVHLVRRFVIQFSSAFEPEL